MSNGTGSQGTGDRQQATNGERATSLLRKGEDIAKRLEWLGAAVLRVASTIEAAPPERKHVAMQLLRAGTSCGANYEEARAAESRADFIHKVSVAAKEARETVFWLRMLESCSIESNAPNAPDASNAPNALSELGRAIDEAEQLAAILTASARTARRNGR